MGNAARGSFVGSAVSGGIIALAIGLAGSARAEDTSATLMRIFFRDSASGIAVVPNSVLMDGKEVAGRINEFGKLEVKAADGDHEFVIRARNYKELKAKESALGADTPTNLIYLDPVATPVELRQETLSKYLSGNNAVVTGFLIDDETGIGMPKVKVQVEGTTVTAESAENGAFRLVVPVTDGGPLPEQPERRFTKKHLLFSSPGYSSELRRNVVVISGQAKIMNVRLAKGNATNSEDESEKRGGLQNWMFEGKEVGHQHEEDSPADNATSAVESAVKP